MAGVGTLRRMAVAAERMLINRRVFIIGNLWIVWIRVSLSLLDAVGRVGSALFLDCYATRMLSKLSDSVFVTRMRWMGQGVI